MILNIEKIVPGMKLRVKSEFKNHKIEELRKFANKYVTTYAVDYEWRSVQIKEYTKAGWSIECFDMISGVEYV